MHMLPSITLESSSMTPRKPKPLSHKSIRNAHATLSWLWEKVIGLRDPEVDSPTRHGALFAFDPGVRGLPEPKFGG